MADSCIIFSRTGRSFWMEGPGISKVSRRSEVRNHKLASKQHQAMFWHFCGIFRMSRRALQTLLSGSRKNQKCPGTKKSDRVFVPFALRDPGEVCARSSRR